MMTPQMTTAQKLQAQLGPLSDVQTRLRCLQTSEENETLANSLELLDQLLTELRASVTEQEKIDVPF